MRFAAPASAIIQYEKQKRGFAEHVSDKIIAYRNMLHKSLRTCGKYIPARIQSFFLSQRKPLGVLTKPISQHPILSR